MTAPTVAPMRPAATPADFNKPRVFESNVVLTDGDVLLSLVKLLSDGFLTAQRNGCLGLSALTSQNARIIPGRFFEACFLSGGDNGRVRADRA